MKEPYRYQIKNFLSSVYADDETLDEFTIYEIKNLICRLLIEKYKKQQCKLNILEASVSESWKDWIYEIKIAGKFISSKNYLPPRFLINGEESIVIEVPLGLIKLTGSKFESAYIVESQVKKIQESKFIRM